MKTKTIIITSMTVFALLVGAFLGITSLVSAQGAEPIASQHRGGGGGENLESVAEALGVTVEELQTALQNARPAECANLERGERPEGVNCKPDFESIANELGVTVQELESAFETARQEARIEKLTSAAETLGVTVEELQTALENARPAECADLERDEKPEGVDCKPDFESVATELGVTTEELQTALQNERGPRGHGTPHGNGGQPHTNP
jgi:transcriptional regulator with XRE-family HTH domain